MARISDLPPEVLVVAFGHLAEDRPDDPPGQHARTHSRTNFSFTHVCREWRNVALAEPRLWTRIFTLSTLAECVLAMLERSRDLPLVMDIPCPRYTADAP
jgi:hypothetical protein